MAGACALHSFAAAAGTPRLPPSALSAGLPPAVLGGPCLVPGTAYLRARIRGATRLNLTLSGPGLTCEGGPRRDGSGIRMGFAGRAGAAGRVRMIFGIDGARAGRAGRELPANLTMIFEDGKRIFATQGHDNCTIDRLTQRPIGGAATPTRARVAVAPAHSPKARAYRIVAHGFCMAPINDVSGRERIVVTTFDFAGRVDFNIPRGSEGIRP